ncbi:Caudovirus, tape measure, N-terminal [uncultured Caudovirales phage]|uniref:Caudovirus, tape measure, N-terminal n=1 Tax=uncultured Caudovirales phage TaxID=2100421 RepID=A0A6J5LBZ5_9CAUD|nr:Caudovirus, tape measure, N-terminal [uncultured Caudovirales phage]
MSEDITFGFKLERAGLDQAAQAAQQAAASMSKLGDEVDDLLKKTAQLDRATASVADQQKVLDQAFSKGAISVDQYVKYLGFIKGAHEDTAEAAKASGDAAEAMGQKTATMSGKISASAEDVNKLVAALKGEHGLGGMVASARTALTGLVETLGVTATVGIAASVGVGLLGMAFAGAMNYLSAYEDKLNAVQTRLRLIFGDNGAAKEAIGRIAEMTQKTGTGFEGAEKGYEELSRINDMLGLSRKQLLQVTETLQKTGAMSGASPQQVQSGLSSFYMGLGTGELQSLQLRSLQKELPALADLIAKNFQKADGSIGVTTAQLKKLGAEGQLTSDRVVEALLRMQDQVNKGFEEAGDTVAQAHQRLEDSWDHLMAHIGQAWNSSAFARALVSWKTSLWEALDQVFTGGDLDRRIETARVKFEDAMAHPRMYGDAGIERARKEFRDLLEEKHKAEKEEAEADARSKSAATYNKGDTAAMKYRSLGQQQFQLRRDIDLMTAGSIAAGDDLIDKGGNDPELAKKKADLAESLAIAYAKLAENIGVYDKAARTLSDNERARAIGGEGGGMQIALSAISQQRAALGQGDTTHSEASFRAIALQQKIEDLEGGLAAARRSAESAEGKVGLAGQPRDALDQFEIETALIEKRTAAVGNLGKNSAALAKVLKDYADLMKREKDAAHLFADAGAAEQAESGLRVARAGLAADLDPRSQARAALEARLAETRRKAGGSNEMIDRDSAAQREQMVVNEELAQRKALYGMDQSLAKQREMAKLVGFTSDEYRVQTALIAKKFDLEAQGYTAEDKYFKDVMAKTEMMERIAIADSRRTAQARGIFDTLQKGVANFEGVFKNSFETIFTYGAGKAASVFGTGMTDIVKKIGADMMYEIAVRPFEVLAQQMASKLGQFIVGFLGGGAGVTAATSSYGGGMSSISGAGMVGNAKGLVGNAKGGVYSTLGAYSNKIVDRPTVFAFAKGAGIMGEAGEEAIMPLKRGSDGRLGVTGTGGGDVQVVVNDMRSSNSEPVKTESKRGADGRRIISVMIRDAIKTSMNSGEMDSTMAGNFGAGRVLARQ